MDQAATGSPADSLFAVAPDLDTGPRYRTIFRAEQQESLLGIDPQPLVAAIEAHLQSHRQRATPLPVPAGLSLDTLQHLHAAWGQAAERSFQRTAGQGTLTLCVGMSALHFYLGGQRSFSEILKNPGTRPAQFSATARRQAGKKTSGAMPSMLRRHGNADVLLPYEEIEYPQLQDDDSQRRVRQQPAFADLRPADDQSQPWRLLPGVAQRGARRVAGRRDGRHSRTRRPRLEHRGGALDSSGAWRWHANGHRAGRALRRTLRLATGAHPDDHSQYLRACCCRQISAIDLPATLLAPRLPFQEGNKVMINTNGEERRAGLEQRVASTNSFNQFAYRSLETARNDNAAGSGAEEEFDSLWKSL